MALYNNELWQKPVGSTGFYTYQISQSCRFDAASSSRLSRTFGTPSSTTAFTVSFWMKVPSIPGYSQIFSRDNGYAGGGAAITFEDDMGGGDVNLLSMYGMAGSGGGNNGGNTYPANEFIDNTGWYHIHYKLDTSKSGMSGNNAKVVMHINGVLAVFTTTNEPSGNWTRFNTNGDSHSIGNGASGTQGDKYLAEFIFLDGQYEDYTSFGSFKNGIWIPDSPSGLTFGNNGFHLKFANSGNLGLDSSGNGNNFTSTGLDTDHQVTDSPTHEN